MLTILIDFDHFRSERIDTILCILSMVGTDLMVSILLFTVRNFNYSVVFIGLMSSILRFAPPIDFEKDGSINELTERTSLKER